MSIRNAARYIDALRASGEQVREEWQGKRKVFRLEAPSSPPNLPPAVASPTRGTSARPTHVRIWFSSRAVPIVRGHRWASAQQLREVADGIELSMAVDDTASLQAYVMGFGDDAEVLEPASLRNEFGRVLARAARRYQKRPVRPSK
jgi:predicted DNA-binding transcriptional regulator YafY